MRKVDENERWLIGATFGWLGETDVDKMKRDIQNICPLYASLFQAPRATYEKNVSVFRLTTIGINLPNRPPPYHRTIMYSLDHATVYKQPYLSLLFTEWLIIVFEFRCSTIRRILEAFEPTVCTQIPKTTLEDTNRINIAYLPFRAGPGRIFCAFFGALVDVAREPLVLSADGIAVSSGVLVGTVISSLAATCARQSLGLLVSIS